MARKTRVSTTAGRKAAHQALAATRITSVSVKANTAYGSRFQHIHVEATANVGPNQTPEEVVADLKVFVAQQLARSGDLQNLVERQTAAAEREELRSRLGDAISELEEEDDLEGVYNIDDDTERREVRKARRELLSFLIKRF